MLRGVCWFCFDTGDTGFIVQLDLSKDHLFRPCPVDSARLIQWVLHAQAFEIQI